MSRFSRARQACCAINTMNGYGNLKSFTVCGELEQDARGWLFRPQKFIPGAGIGGMRAMVKFVQMGRRSTQEYLDKRNLKRPKIEWDTLHAIWVDVKSANS